MLRPAAGANQPAAALKANQGWTDQSLQRGKPMLVSNGAREHALSAIALYNRFRISNPLHSGDDGSFRRDKGCRSVSVLHEPQVWQCEHTTSSRGAEAMLLWTSSKVEAVLSLRDLEPK